MDVAQPRRRRPRLGGVGWWQLKQDPILLLTVLLVSAALLIFIVYPLVRVFWLSINPRGEFTLDVYRQILDSWWLRQSFYNSLLLGVLTATFSTLIGFIFAFALNRTDMQLKGFFCQMVQLPMI